jgi:hypothetical protein
MIKRIALVALILLLAIAGRTQDTYRTKSVAVAHYNPETKTWLWEEPKPTVLTLTFHGSTLLVSDKAKSTYRLRKLVINEKKEEYTQFGWDAEDEQDQPCIVKIVTLWSTGRLRVLVIYDEIAFAYNIR